MRTSQELAYMQALPFNIKYSMTANRIREAVREFGEDGLYISRSGGKDSDALAKICEELGYNFTNVFVNTGLEHNSIRRHAVSECDVVLTPELSLSEICSKYGYPVVSKEVSSIIYEYQRAVAAGKEVPKYVSDKINGTHIDKKTGKKSPYNIDKYAFLTEADFWISSKCCTFTKKAAAHKYEANTGKVPLVATMACESKLRKSAWLKSNGCNNFTGKRPKSAPLSIWTEQNMLHYLKDRNVNYDKEVYGDIMCVDSSGLMYESSFFYNEDTELKLSGEQRTGCVCCLYGATYAPDKFIKLKAEDPKKFDYVFGGGEYGSDGFWRPNDKGLGFAHVVDFLNDNGMNIRY